MAKTESFDLNGNEYEQWFEKNPLIYADEVQTLKRLVEKNINGLDIGMGSGRFALPLGIKIGVEPSQVMRNIAITKGLHPIKGRAEKLPFNDETFEFAIMITVICFVDDPLKALKEAYRVICKNGFLIIGIVDKNSLLGQMYEADKNKSRFYSKATFYSVQEIMTLAQKAGFFNCSSTGVAMTNKAFTFIKCFKLTEE
ncbi:MAG: class I SAM-dependent methyltransferase [Sulfuricurvum sp.]|nr:class I SAM-dependent methyltransferase [Sulfuricurvum sp.]